SHELSDGGASFEACASPPPWGEGEPVCDPMPARPLPMPGLSRSASESSSTGISGRDALARVGLAGSFFECLAGSRLGRFAMPTIWVESVGRKSRHSGARAIARERGIHSASAGIMDSGLAAVAAIRNDGLSLELDAGAFNHLAPLFRVGSNGRGEFLRRAACGLVANRGEALFEAL